VRFRPRPRLALALTVVATVGLGAAGSARAVRAPGLNPNRAVIAGPGAPGSEVVGLSVMSIARDGTGAVAFVQNVGGVAHVFVSRLLGGAFQPPQQVDAGLPGASSHPVIAADSGGLLLVAFVNAGQIEVAGAPDADTPVSAPVALAPGDTPSLAISPFGKAYLAYAASGQVQWAYWTAAAGWAPGSGAVDATSAAAGAGSDAPQVAACGDGIGIVTWGEGGHVYARRLIATTPSVQVLQADPPTVQGLAENSATGPVISCVGLSNFVAIAFTEALTAGGQSETRVVYDRLHAEQFDGGQPADGLGAAIADAGQPAVAVTETGAGWLTTAQIASHELDGLPLGADSAPGTPLRLDSLANAGPPFAVPAAAGLSALLVTWQQTPGVAGPAEIRVRYAPHGGDLGAEQVVSDPTAGATDAALGLVDGGDLSGDAAVAWVQDTASGPAIVAAQLAQPPGPLAPDHPARRSRSARPMLGWSASGEAWGPVTYSLTVDGRPAGATAATSLRPATALGQGRHAWRVTAHNQAGLHRTARAAEVFVDTIGPHASLRVAGRRVHGPRLRVRLHAADATAPHLPRSTASGLRRVGVSWGDGRRTRVPARAARRGVRLAHVYRRRGTYPVTLTATDRAGNRVHRVHRVTVARGRR
jgi:hypothetical protein